MVAGRIRSTERPGLTRAEVRAVAGATTTADVDAIEQASAITASLRQERSSLQAWLRRAGAGDDDADAPATKSTGRRFRAMSSRATTWRRPASCSTRNASRSPSSHRRPMPDPLDPSDYRDLVRRALAEDVGPGDITTAAIVPADAGLEAGIVAKRECVLAGMDVARDVFAAVDPAISFLALSQDGDVLRPGSRVATVTGPAAGVLTAERTALNFLQYLSGIATRTREFVEAAGGRIAVLDTRKTTPTFRALAKYAVRCGGGVNHRVGLYDGDPDQGQPHQGSGKRGGGRQAHPCRRFGAADRSRGAKPGGGGRRPRRRRRHHHARQPGRCLDEDGDCQDCRPRANRAFRQHDGRSRQGARRERRRLRVDRRASRTPHRPWT